MPIEPGYNFVRAGAAVSFFKDFQQEYPDDALESVSVLEFLRMLQHRQPPKHRCIQVTGFDRLWNVCEDDPLLCNRMRQLLSLRANWLKEHVRAVYLVIPRDTEFMPGVTVQMRLPTGEHADIDRVFGHPSLKAVDHYNRPFSPS